jgi:LysM repeat protein
VRIRRRGRHASPSQVEKVAQQAGKAAPAVAIAGALVAAPTAQAFASTDAPATSAAQAHETATAFFSEITTTGPKVTGAMLESFATRSITVATASTARHAAVAKSTHYTVRSGDTLSTIAKRFYHKAADWQYLYHENQKQISDPDSIYEGESLFIPATVPASFKPTAYTPKHAVSTPAASTPSSSTSDSTSSGGSGGGSGSQSSSTSATTDSTVTVQSAPAPQGSYSCSALEQLWDSAGGNPSDAFMAAEIAMAESGGNPNAVSPTNDYGLWQINGSNGSLATLDPFANAKSAIILSGNGTNWGPWTTYTSGAYSGKC